MGDDTRLIIFGRVIQKSRIFVFILLRRSLLLSRGFFFVSCCCLVIIFLLILLFSPLIKSCLLFFELLWRLTALSIALCPLFLLSFSFDSFLLSQSPFKLDPFLFLAGLFFLLESGELLQPGLLSLEFFLLLLNLS